MVFFEVKKLIKKNVVFLVLFFAFLSSFAGFFLQKEQTLSQRQFRVASDQFAPFPMFLSMNQSELTKKEEETYKETIYSAPHADASYALETAIKTIPLADPTYNEQYHRLVKYKLEENTRYIELYDAMTAKNPRLKTEQSDRIAEIGRWENYKNEKIIAEDLQDPYYPTHLGGDNLVQAFLFQQERILGVWQLLFFLVLFSPFYAKEREQGTLSLLHTQAYSRSAILRAKTIVIGLSILLYIIGTFLFFTVMSILRGIPFTGFQDIYRLITGEEAYTLVRGGVLLLQVVGAFFITAFMVSLFALFLSTRFSSAQALAICLASFALLYLFSKNTMWLKNVANPIYGVQSFNVLLGYFALQTDAAGVTTLQCVFAFLWFKYGIYVFASVLLFILCSFPKDNVTASSSDRMRRRITSLYAFEQKKCLLSQGALIYVLAFVLLIASNFFILAQIDHNTELEHLGEQNAYRTANQDRIQDQQQALEEFDARIAKMDSSHWTEEDEEEVLQDRELYLSEIENAKEIASLYEAYIDAYKKGDGKQFYSLVAALQRAEGINDVVLGLANDTPGERTQTMDQELLQKAAEQDCPPMLSFGANVSALETHSEPSFIKKNSENANYASHSASYFPFRLIRSHQLTLWIDALVVLIAGVGYAIDREHGVQYALLFTNGISRKRYTLKKFIAQWGLGISILLFGFLFVTLIGFVTDGMGDYRFPVTMYQQVGTETIPVWLYYVRWLGAMVASITFIVSLQLALSFFVDSKAKLLGVFGLLLAAGLLFMNRWEQIKGINPFLYLKSNVVADQSIAIIDSINRYSYPMALAVLFGWALLLLFLSYHFVNRLNMR